jgi:glycosyltransferase involved in cell wall biosynthesis/ADP-heptose:LPS heptosyltransferase
VVELWGLGDLVIATPFLRAAGEKFNVTLLAKPYGENLRARFWPEVKVHPFIAPWTAFRHKYRLLAWPWRQILGLRRLAAEGFDVGLTARWDPRDHVLLRLFRAKRRLGFPRLGSEIFLTDPLAPPKQTPHRYEYWRVLAQALHLELPPREGLAGSARPESGAVLVHTGAGQEVRVWPLERYRNLIGRLRAANYSVLVACDPDQRSWWLRAGERGVATPRNVTELLALFDRCRVFLGNDSGPGHLAALCGIPTFTLFGPQLPERFAPLHPAAEWIEGAPCPFKPCSDDCHFPVPHCIVNLEEQAVAPRIYEFVARHCEPAPAPALTAGPEKWRAADERPGAAGIEPRRILHVHNGADIYGASRSLLRLIQVIDRRRFQPLVVLPEAGPLKELIETEGVEVLVHPRLSIITRPVFRSWRLLLFILNYPISVLFLRGLIRRRGIECVHTNTGVIISPAVAAWLARVPHVWHIRDWFQEFRFFWPFLSWYIRTFSRKIVTVSNAIAGQFAQRDRVTVIHNGFSGTEFQVPKVSLRAGFRERHGLDHAFVVGSVGRIKLVRKGQEVLLEATALLKRRGLPIKALIVGSPFPGNEGHLAQLQNLARELKIEQDVVFTGEVPDARPAYAAMDVLAMTSMQPEPFGGVVMEAMSMALPVVATSIGGSLEQVVEDVTGLFVPPGDAVRLAEAVEKLLHDPARRGRMGQAGAERIATHFSLAETISRIEAVFDETLPVRKS